MNSNLIELQNYSLPNQDNLRIATLYPVIPRKTDAVQFDIYDYEMLFADKKTVDLIRKGNTIGCFYIESPAMRSLLKRLGVETFEMLTAASSVIRPGVAESGMMQEFIARHHDPRRRKYLVPDMETYLGETYGVMIYQEDVIKVAHHIAGLSLEEADVLRRAMSGKMRSHKAMEALTKRFFDSCKDNKLSNYVARELWRQIESFAGYSFCKAHSASFALLSFQVAFLKVYYPAEFMASVLSNGGGFYSAAVYIQESKRLGLDIKLPCINNSEIEYKGSGNILQIGLMAVKNLSRTSMEIIVEERKAGGKYNSLPDFIIRTKLGFEETSSLIKCGAMDCFKQTRPTLLRLLDVYMKRRRILDEKYNDLFMNESFNMEEEVKTKFDYSIQQKSLIEYETFGYMVTRHPLEFFEEYTSDKSIVKASEIEHYANKKVKMIGWYMTSKRIKTRKGDIMKFISLEDTTGTFETVIFPNVYSKVAEKTLSMGPYLIEGKVDMQNGNNIIVQNLDLISDIALKAELQLDTAEKVYQPSDEGMREEDFHLAKSLNTEILIKAYAG